MRKLIFALSLLIGLFVKSFGQYTSGNLLLSGTVNVESSKYQSSNRPSSSFTVLPSVGYFVSDHVVVGGSIGFSSSKSVDGSTTTKAKDFWVGPFARFYKPLSDENKFSLFIQTSLLMDFGKVDYSEPGLTAISKYSAINFNVGPGFAYYPGKKFGMELKVNGLTYSVVNPQGSNNNYSSFSLGLSSLSPSLGFTFLL